MPNQTSMLKTKKISVDDFLRTQKKDDSKIEPTIKQRDKFETKKQNILMVAKKYISKDGKANMGEFRKEHPNLYSLLNYYFGGVNGLISELENAKPDESHKKSSGRGCPLNGQSVRNELAFDMLLLLRKNHTLNEIGEMYGVSRAHIHQLLQTMDENSYLEERPIKVEYLV
jgi:hypothetical protein